MKRAKLVKTEVRLERLSPRLALKLVAPRTWNLLYWRVKSYPDVIGTIALERGRYVPYTNYEPHKTDKKYTTRSAAVEFLRKHHS